MTVVVATIARLLGVPNIGRQKQKEKGFDLFE